MSISDFNTGQFNWRFYASNIRSNPGQNLILDASGSSNLSMTTNGTERFRVSDSSSVFFTNLDISGNGLRLRGDFSSGISSRLCLQSYVPNGNSLVGIIPNGTATIGRLTLFNGSDPANVGALVIESTSTSNNITSSFTGTGTTRPIVLSYSGGGSITLDTSANFSTVPNCSALPTLPTNLMNKAYIDASFGFSGACFSFSLTGQTGGVSVLASASTNITIKYDTGFQGTSYIGANKYITIPANGYYIVGGQCFPQNTGQVTNIVRFVSPYNGSIGSGNFFLSTYYTITASASEFTVPYSTAGFYTAGTTFGVYVNSPAANWQVTSSYNWMWIQKIG